MAKVIVKNQEDNERSIERLSDFLTKILTKEFVIKGEDRQYFVSTAYPGLGFDHPLVGDRLKLLFAERTGKKKNTERIILLMYSDTRHVARICLYAKEFLPYLRSRLNIYRRDDLVLIEIID